MYQCRCTHWNTDTDSTDTDLTDGTEALRSVSPMRLKRWDQCHRQHWHTEIGVTDDTETLISVCHCQCFDAYTDMLRHPQMIRHVSLSSVTSISVFQCHRWHWTQCFSVVGDTDVGFISGQYTDTDTSLVTRTDGPFLVWSMSFFYHTAIRFNSAAAFTISTLCVSRA